MLRFRVEVFGSVESAVVAAEGFVERDADPWELGLGTGGSAVVGFRSVRGREGLGMGYGGEGPDVEDCAAAGAVGVCG